MNNTKTNKNERADSSHGEQPISRKNNDTSRATTVSHTTAAVRRASASDAEPWLTRYTMTTFPKLHAQVYQVIQTLMEQEPQDPTDFTIKWGILTSPFNPNRMTEKMTWKQLEHCLNINDFQQYKEFILQCPLIQDHIKLVVQKNAIEFGVLPRHEVPLNSVTEDTPGIVTMEKSTDSDDPLIKDDTNEEIKHLLAMIIPEFQHYVEENTDDDYARLCQEWFQQGLHMHSTLPEVYKICKILTMQDLYILLKLSPALREKHKVSWENDRISIQQIPQPNPAVDQTTSPNQLANTVTDDETWQHLHSTAFPYIERWSQDNINSHLAHAWKMAIEAGINGNTNWKQIQQQMNIDTYREYYHYIFTCPYLTTKMKLYLNTTTGTILYKLLPQENIPVPVTPQRQLPSNIHLPSLQSTYTSAIPQHVGSKVVNPTTTAMPSTILDDNFPLVHSLLYHSVDTWHTMQSTQHHPFIPKWSYAKYHGLKAQTTWLRIKDNLKIRTYGDYINYMQQCPAVMTQYKLKWDQKNNTIDYINNKPTEQQIDDTKLRIDATYTTLQQMAHHFEAQVHKMKIGMDDMYTHFTSIENKIEQQTTKGNDRITRHANTKLDEIQNNIATHLSTYAEKLKQHSDKKTAQFIEDLDTVAHNLYSNVHSHISEVTEKATLQWKEAERTDANH